jgi:hypothetical protein
MALGPSIVGHLQDASGSPAAGLIAGVVLLGAIVPLSLSFVFFSSPHRLGTVGGDAELGAAT